MIVDSAPVGLFIQFLIYSSHYSRAVLSPLSQSPLLSLLNTPLIKCSLSLLQQKKPPALPYYLVVQAALNCPNIQFFACPWVRVLTVA